MRAASSIMLFGAIAFAAAIATGEDFGSPTPDIPELAPLAHYAGKWDVTFADGKTKADTTARWILGGRFLQQMNIVRPADGGEEYEMMTLMTYDPDKKTYSSWMFVSNGVTSQGEGTWDGSKNVMTTILRTSDSENTTTITADFSEADVENWHIVTKDPSGNTVFEVSGTNRRRRQ